MSLTFAYGRTTLPSTAWTVTSTTGGNIPAGTYYLSLQGRNRIGCNLPIYTSITVANNSTIVITLNSDARVAGEDWHYYVVEMSTTNDVSTYRQIAKIPGINPTDQTSFISLPITTNITATYLTNVSTLPTSGLVNGTVIGYLPNNLIYEYDYYDSTTTVNNTTVLAGAGGKRWKVKSNLTNYITNIITTGGCAQDLRSITDPTGIIVPKYNPNVSVASLSTAVRYVLTPSITATIDKGTRIGVVVNLSGLDKSSLFSSKLYFTPEGFVNLTDFTLKTTLNDNTTPMSSVGTVIEYVYGKPYLLLDDDLTVDYGYQFKVQLKFTSAEYASLIPEGSAISLNLDFTDSVGIYQELGDILGNLMFSDSGKGRVYPDTGLGVIIDSRSGLIQNYSFPSVNATNTIGLIANTANQYIVINKNGNAYVAFPNIPSDAALRALVSTISGRTNPTTWSSNIALTTSQGLQLVIPYPYANSKGIIRSDYFDIIAGTNNGVFNVPQLVVYVKNMTTTTIKEFTFNVVVGTNQTVSVLDWSSGTTISNTVIQTDNNFSLFSPLIPTSNIAVTGGSNFTADNYQVSYCYQYTGNQVTKISHLSTDLSVVTSKYIYELDSTFADSLDKLKYVAAPVTNDTILRSLSIANRSNYQLRYVINKNKSYRFDPSSYLTDDTDNSIKPNDIATNSPGRWISSGVTWYTGTTVPDNTIGKIADYYLLTTTGDIYLRGSSSWSIIANIKGANGANGINGSTWYTASGVPSSGTGTNGDYYLNSANGDYYSKVSGAWALQGSLRGIQGISSTWYSGSSAPSSGLGNNGDLYLLTTTSDVYQKASSTWSIITNIKGATGAAGSISGSISSLVFDWTGTAPTTTSTQGAIWNNNGAFQFRNISSGSNNTFAFIDKVQSYTKPQTITPQTLTYAGTIAIDGSLTEIFRLTLTGNATLSNPSNLVDGTTYLFWVIQDSTGSRTITWGTNYDFGALGVPTLTTTASKKDLLSFISDGTKLYYLGIAKGYS